MTRKPKEDIVYLDHILDYAGRVERILTRERDFMAELAAVRAVEVIGEAVNQLSPELCKQYGNVPWRQIIDMRNLLIHGYFDIDMTEVWRTCENDIPLLKQAISAIKKENFV